MTAAVHLPASLGSYQQSERRVNEGPGPRGRLERRGSRGPADTWWSRGSGVAAGPEPPRSSIQGSCRFLATSLQKQSRKDPHFITPTAPDSDR